MGYYIGVDVGSVSINCVAIDAREALVHEAPYRRHFGMVCAETLQTLQAVCNRYGQDQIDAIAFTGNQGQRLAAHLGAPFEVETIAQVLGAVHVAHGVRSLMSIGGQDAALFELDYDAQGHWRLVAFNVNGPCASGTGSFIDQQAERLTLAMYGDTVEMNQAKTEQVLADFIALGTESTYPAPVACRCTVFTKSDMIHLQNKGESLANIIAGLHYGTAANYLSTLVANRVLAGPIAFIGGMASNRLQVEAFRAHFPDLQVPPYHTSLGALGAALRVKRAGQRHRPDLEQLREAASNRDQAIPRTKPLQLQQTRFETGNRLSPLSPAGTSVDAFLGLDIGSTSTKYALIDAGGRLIHKDYVPTRGKPIEVSRQLLVRLQEAIGSRIRLKAVATTGSGRNVVGDFLKADLVIDEITAHARGAVAVDGRIDTIFEIGGQDSKYIAIERTHPTDFAMNKVCAAGTGSFLHELANKLNINIQGAFQAEALSAPAPVNLAERCTVFMESDLTAYAQQGAARNDLIAGLCYAIVRNYLHRVVENRRIGDRIMFLGGPSLNKGIVAAFENVLNKPILVPPHREVMGAFGAALAVRERLGAAGKSQSGRDLAMLAGQEVAFAERICRADKACRNECKLKIYRFGDRQSVWGGECGRFERTENGEASEPDHFLKRRHLFEQALTDCGGRIGPAAVGHSGRPRIGVPLSLHALEWGVFWAQLLSGLGGEAVFSAATRQDTVAAGMESMTAETCFPIKVFHGHVRQLLQSTDYLFLPTVIDMQAPGPDEKAQFCPLVESAPHLVRAALRIDDARIIRPTMHLKRGPESLVPALRAALPDALRPPDGVIQAALLDAWTKQADFLRMLRGEGQALLSSTLPDEPVWILTGRPYNLHDQRLNLQLGRQFSKLGIKALPMDLLDLDDEPLHDFPRMYWGLGARILRAARKIARTPNWYGVHLTNFSCGPDSFLEHFYSHLMGRKPYLILELDEHSAVAGILTRIEAFRNVVENVRLRPDSGRVPHAVREDARS